MLELYRRYIDADIQKQNTNDHRWNRFIRECGFKPVFTDGHWGDSGFFAGREEAGRHAARVSGTDAGGSGEDQVLHWRRPESAILQRRDAWGGLHIPCGGIKASAVL